MTSTVAEPTTQIGREEELKAMYAQINAKNMFPFWAKRSDVEHDEIKQLMEGVKAVPFHWSYKRDLEPLIHQSARLINHADSDRRSLVLVNPGLKKDVVLEVVLKPGENVVKHNLKQEE